MTPTGSTRQALEGRQWILGRHVIDQREPTSKGYGPWQWDCSLFTTFGRRFFRFAGLRLQDARRGRIARPLRLAGVHASVRSEFLDMSGFFAVSETVRLASGTCSFTATTI